MTIACHEHNRSRALPGAPKTWGIRLSLPENDPMRPILGEDWHEYQWFATEALREAKLEQLRRQFVYYRKGDQPSFILERMNRDKPDAGSIESTCKSPLPQELRERPARNERDG